MKSICLKLRGHLPCQSSSTHIESIDISPSPELLVTLVSKVEAGLLALSAALQAGAVVAEAEESLVLACGALILAVSHVLVEAILAVIAARAVRVAVGAARNEIIAFFDDDRRL